MNDSDQALLSVEQLGVYFHIPYRKGLSTKYHALKAIDGVSFSLQRGETLGVVGESGCGKSTMGRAIVRLLKPSAGAVFWKGQDMRTVSDKKGLNELRQEIQMIFQDPFASLNPRMTIGEIIEEPLHCHHRHLTKQQRVERVENMLTQVGLLKQMINRYPHEFSGGQCQRIGIARAMILEPELIVCDEPVSALDVSIQAQIVNLLKKLQTDFSLSMIFISHDLSIVRHISHRIMVLYLGHVVELCDSHELFKRPLHPYTQALISAVPTPNPNKEKTKKRMLLTGDLPSPINPPSGCVFRTRCPKAQDICAQQKPTLVHADDSKHQVACHFWDQ